MRFLLLPFLLLFSSIHSKVNNEIEPKSTVEKIENLRIGKKSFETVRDMHHMWYIHSIKALLVQMAKGIIPKLDTVSEREFLLCLNRIPVKTDIVRTSQCLVKAKESIDSPRIVIDSMNEMNPFVIEDDTTTMSSTTTTTSTMISMKKNKKMTKEERMNRIMARKWKKMREERKKRRELIQRHARFFNTHKNDYHKRVKRSEYRLVEPGMKKNRYNNVKTMSYVPDLLSPKASPIQLISKGILKIVRGENDDAKAPKWSETYKNILKMKNEMDDQSKSTGARVYDLPMDELVFNKTSDHSKPRRSVEMPSIVREAFNLADSIRSHSSKTRDDTNYKMLSPRFVPVFPDKYEGRGVLSPSILSFYKDDGEDQLVPLPTLLESTGMEKKDRESMLEMIMEVSGARETVDKAFETLKKMNLFGMEGELVEVTKRIQDAFKSLEGTFTRKQRVQMKKRQYTLLDKDQLSDLFQKQGIRSEHHEDLDLEEYGKLTHKQREESLWKRIEVYAANGTIQEPHYRSKRQVVIPNVLSVLNPTVLAPYMFTPILGFTVLGPVVLSPSLFSPLLLNPAVLSPYVMSPAVGMPFILSPYLLSPYVLSPLVMAPFILNPYVLSPNVINPYVLSPLILSPLVLCPDVLSPMVLGGAILSPAVASPAMFSKSTLMASVLSPSVLS